MKKNHLLFLFSVFVFVSSPGFLVVTDPDDGFKLPPYFGSPALVLEPSNRTYYPGDPDSVFNTAGLTPERLAFLDDYARKTPETLKKRKLQTLVNYLIKPAQSEMEKVRLLFTWVATHYAYDEDAASDDDYEIPSIKAIFRGKTAICSEYACVLRELCQISGMEAVMISGFSKPSPSDTSRNPENSRHAWNAIKINNSWRLFDVTYASNSWNRKKEDSGQPSCFSMSWFNVDPKEFILRHFPDTIKWQLLGENSLTKVQFLKIPYIPSEFFNVGFKGKDLLSLAISTDKVDLVKVYALNCPVEILEAPLLKCVKLGSLINFSIRSKYAQKIRIRDNDDQFQLNKSGDQFTLKFTPHGNTLVISVKFCEGCDYKKLLEYKIIP